MEKEPNEEIALILDDYLRSLDRPVPISPDELLEQHPQYADQLRLYLFGLELLHESTAGFAGGFDQDAKTDDDKTTSRTLGDFELLDEIGRGGMGVVFRAKQVSLNRIVAVKILPFAAVLDSKQIARFKTEARTAALVHHPNIVPVYAIGQHQGVHFYAMHLVDGASLADIDDLTIREIAAVGIDAARALHAAHEHGVVHRDIKPSNLLLDNQSKLWITDFGLARIQSGVSLTQTRDVIGTIPYMSPEQACGNNLGVDHRTDIYSLGATLYELLTGRRVIEEDDPADIFRRMDAEPIRPRVLNADIPRDLETVVLKCLEKSKEARYDTASDLADDLQRFLDGIPTLAKPASLIMKSSKWMRRHQRLVALLTSFLAVLVTVLGVSTVLILRESGRKEVALHGARLSAVAAQQNYRDARTAVDHFGSQIAEQLVGVPGTESIRDSILTDTLAYYERFVERSGSEPSSRLDTAVTLTKIADLRQRSGQTLEAIEAYRQADELLEQQSLQRHPAGISRMGTLAGPIELGQECPNYDGCSTDLLIQRINCKNNLALLLSRDGQVEEAQTIVNELVRFESHNLPDTNVLLHVYNNAGLLAEQQGDFQRARQCYESALQLQETGSSWRDRATTLNNLGMLSRREGQNLQAADQLKSVIELHVTNYRADHPKHATFRHEYAIAESNLASVYSSIDQLRDSLEHYTLAADVLSELSDVSPGSVAVETDLASAINNIGLMQSRLGQHRTAIDSFQRAFKVQQDVTESQPNVAANASALASISSNLGVAYTSVQRLREARAAFQRAIQFQTKAIELAPNVERYAMLLTQHRRAWENIHEE